MTETAKPMLSERTYGELREAILRGEFTPGQALKPQELARERMVSLAVVREALVRLVGDGLADRLPNRGFAVPPFSDRRLRELTEARRTIEPAMLRLAMEHGDLEWEARVRAAHHRLSRTPMRLPQDAEHVSTAWSHAHHDFHRALLEGCGNDVLLDTFDRLWTACELARLWSFSRTPDRDIAAEHHQLEEAALARDQSAAELLDQHLARTAAAVTDYAHATGPA